MGIVSSIGKLRDMMHTNTGPNSKGTLRQLHEMAQIGLRRQIFPPEYYLYRFHERDKDYRYMLQFMPNRAHFNDHLPALVDRKWLPLLGNKWFFQLHYGGLGLPLPTAYGYYDRQSGFGTDGRSLRSPGELERLLRELQPRSLVIKPVGGTQGLGLLILDELQYESEHIGGTTVDGRRISFPDIAAHLDRDLDRTARYTGYLLQEKLEQHAALAEVNPYTMNTLRVVTFLDKAGEVHVHYTVLRLGREGMMVDNWGEGGISVYVDPQTGALGRGVIKPKHGGQRVDRHPDSGVAFAGRTVPDWDRIVGVCTHAARVTPNLRSVGWDVVVTPSGPKLIEGNYDWGITSLQVHGKGYLQPEVREQLAQYGLRFPTDKLPGVNLRSWWKLLRE